MAKKTTKAAKTVESNPMMDLLNKISNNMDTLTSRMETLEKKTASIGINTRTTEPLKPTTEQLVKLALAKMSDSSKFITIRDKVRINGFSLDPTGWNQPAMDAVIYAYMLGCRKSENKATTDTTADTTNTTNTTNTNNTADTTKVFTCESCKFKPNCKKLANGLEDTCYHLRKARNIQNVDTPKTIKAVKASTLKTDTEKNSLTGRQLEVYNMLKEGMSKAEIEEALEITIHGTIYALKKKGYTW